VYPYTGWAANAVKRMKYRDEFDRANQLAPLMAGLAAEMGSFDALVPVPLHRSRYDERGYNQSEILAVAISEFIGVPVKSMLRRMEVTVPQASLSLEERRKNVASAFAVGKEWAPALGERYLVIDDVRTSGATLNACASALVAAGSDPVCALTFALDLQGRELEAFLKRRT
jgi:ComF family protein